MALSLLFSLILVSFITDPFQLVKSEEHINLDLGPGASVEVWDVRPCVERNESVKRLDMDLWVLQENFTDCDNNEQRETVSHLVYKIKGMSLILPIIDGLCGFLFKCIITVFQSCQLAGRHV